MFAGIHKIALWPRLHKIIVLCAITALTAGCEPRIDNEIHLIPAGYVGAVLIVFNDPGGVPEEYENGWRVYRIGANGVLRTRFRLTYGVGKGKFFYMEPGGHREEIHSIWLATEKGDAETIYVYAEVIGTHAVSIPKDGHLVLGTDASPKEGAINTQKYIVGRTSDADSLTRIAVRLEDSVARSYREIVR